MSATSAVGTSCSVQKLLVGVFTNIEESCCVSAVFVCPASLVRSVGAGFLPDLAHPVTATAAWDLLLSISDDEVVVCCCCSCLWPNPPFKFEFKSDSPGDDDETIGTFLPNLPSSTMDRIDFSCCCVARGFFFRFNS